MISILFVAGGTGGHVIPALNMAEYITQKSSSLENKFCGEKR